jgi:glycosyl transferase family 25
MWDFIDKIVYINLDNRNDRRIIMNYFFEKGQIPLHKIVRFSAINKNKGIGILESHTQVLRMAKQQNWKNVLILEDDLQWTNLESQYSELENLTKQSWDVILLCGWYQKYNFPRIFKSLNAGAYLVNGTYYDKFLENRDIALKNIYKTGLLKLLDRKSYAADVSWNSLMKQDNWFGLYPCICSQVDGESDNTGRVIKASLASGIYDQKIHDAVFKDAQ